MAPNTTEKKGFEWKLFGAPFEIQERKRNLATHPLHRRDKPFNLCTSQKLFEKHWETKVTQNRRQCSSGMYGVRFKCQRTYDTLYMWMHSIQ